MERQIYTAVDANINRTLEGLRVCEDIMRFCLHRTDLSVRFKEARHRVAEAARVFPQQRILHGRDVEADEQKFIDMEGELTRNSLAGMFSSNLHRATEAVRSLEEFGKLAGAGGNAFQEIRFDLYALERECLSALLRRNAAVRMQGALYALLDSAYVPAGGFAGAAANMIRGGASVIQLRMKASHTKEILKVAREIAELCRQEHVLFIIAGHVDIAILAGADGVHLEMNDICVRDARALVPPDLLVGQTIYSPDEITRAEEDGADYVAVGPVYGTVWHTEAGSMELRGSGVSIVARARGMTSLPVVATGGIVPENAAAVMAAGAAAVMAGSFLFRDGSVEENCRALAAAIKSASRHEQP
ncbi:MAG: thiamine phosphate synthase [Spirochaetes bacterium]|nr:thiamine phosphate synthase [Spirochaetota bacterium]